MPGTSRTSLMSKWIRIHISKQGTQIQSLVQEDPTYLGAAKSTYHN